MLFTGHGDAGYTNVIGGPALPKCDVRLEALGALDEAQAHLGLVRALLADTPWAEPIKRVQTDLQLLMAECAITTSPQKNGCSRYLTEDHLLRLEVDLASWDGSTGGFHEFRVPGSTLLDAHLHVARTAIRRAERRVVALQHDGGMDNPLVLTYLNRLSSWVYGLSMLLGISSGASAVAAQA